MALKIRAMFWNNCKKCVSCSNVQFFRTRTYKQHSYRRHSNNLISEKCYSSTNAPINARVENDLQDEYFHNDDFVASDPAFHKESRKIGFIGAGKMGKSLCQGLLKTGFDVNGVSDSNKTALNHFKTCGIFTSANNTKIAEKSNTLILAVKPKVLPDVLEELKDSITPQHLIISLAAGITLESISKILPEETRVVRLMPNITTMVQCGVCAFSAGKHVTTDDCATVTELFSSVGICEQIEESMMDAVTGLSGSGPAFVFLALEALADGGVRMGLPRELATRFAAQTVMGASRMQLLTGTHPGQLKDEVSSPGGTTIAGLHALERGAFRAVLIDAVQAAAEKSLKIGQ